MIDAEPQGEHRDQRELWGGIAQCNQRIEKPRHETASHHEEAKRNAHDPGNQKSDRRAVEARC
jgi:hypothetical protein